MHGISSWAIRSPIPSLVLFAVLTMAGLFSFFRLPINANPNVDIPTVTVTVSQAGASASELETQVTRRIEGQIAAVSDVRHFTSTIQTGVSSTVVEFELNTPIDRALNDVKDAVDRVRADLPATADAPVVTRLDSEGAAILTYAVAAPDMAPQDLSWFIDDVVARELRAVPGVGQVQRKGGVDREIRVELLADRLDALGITAAQVSAQLRVTNADLSAGRTQASGQDQSIRALGGVHIAQELERTDIVTSGAGSVALGRLGAVVDGPGEIQQVALLNGKPVIAFDVVRAKGSSEVAVAEGAEEVVKELGKRYPGVTFTRIATTVETTLESYHASLEELAIGAGLASVVVFLFLRSWRATLIAAIAMPLSMVPTFAAMSLFGFSLNIISLLGLTLVVGILVDDAIVEIENIIRHGNMGKRPYQAAIEAADEIGLAVVATTMTIVVVFLPVSVMGGVAGQYFREFGISVAAAVFFSLLVARLLTPMLAAYFLEEQKGHESDGRILRAYGRFLSKALRWRWLSLLAGAGVLAGSVWLATQIPAGFLPRSDGDQALLTLELPPGATVQTSTSAAERLTAALRAHPAVESVFVAFGSGGGGPSSSLTEGNATVVLKPKSARSTNSEGETLTLQDFQNEARALVANLPDMRVGFLNGQGARDVAILFVGADPEALAATADRVAAEMAQLNLVTNVRPSRPLPRSEVQIVPRGDEMARLGVSVEDMASAVRIATQGDIDQTLAQFSAGARQLPIRVKLRDLARDDYYAIASLEVPSASGRSVPLRLVADIRLGVGEGTIQRFDRERRVGIEADLTENATLGQAMAAIEALPGYRDLAAGVRIPLYGDAESMAETFGGFAFAMGAGLVLIYVVLVLLFKDMLQPITIMTALPLSLSGAFGALMLAGMPLDVLSLIGLLMLMGIVSKNSILLVEYAIEEIRAGVPRHEALVDAGLKRARPIVMTTIAMVAGMLVPALGIGAGAELRAPMAVVVIGGLSTSTLLSLVFVPVIFTFMDDLKHLVGPIFMRLATFRKEDAGKDGS